MNISHSTVLNHTLEQFVHAKKYFAFNDGIIVSGIQFELFDKLLFLKFDNDYIIDRSIIYCYQLNTGSLLWKTDIKEIASFECKQKHAAPITKEHGQVISFIGNTSENEILIHIAPIRILALNTVTGHINWISKNINTDIPVGRSFFRDCLMDNSKVYFLRLHDVYQMDFETREWQLLCTFENSSIHWQFEYSTLYKGLVFFTGRSDFGTMPDTIGIFDPIKRDVIWNIKLSEVNHNALFFHNSIYFANNCFYILDSEQVLHQFMTEKIDVR